MIVTYHVNEKDMALEQMSVVTTMVLMAWTFWTIAYFWDVQGRDCLTQYTMQTLGWASR